MLIQFLTHIRHGRLSRAKWLWWGLRKAYRLLMAVTPPWMVSKRIHRYGPFRMDRRFAFSNFAQWGQGHNRGFESCVESCRGARCVIDVGAHIGLVAMPVSTVLAPGGKVYAFEPAEENLRYLKLHLAANSLQNVEVVPWLVGPSSYDAVPFYEAGQATGMNSVAVRTKNPGEYRQTVKQQVSLDDFCRERGLLPEIIKIDAEGAEVGILQGASETVKKARPLIYLSVHPHELGLLGQSLDDLKHIIHLLGYCCTDIEGNQTDQLAGTEYILCPAERVKQGAAGLESSD